MVKSGTCCACGDVGGDEETACPKRDDKIHCVHWYDGPDDEEGS